MDAIKAQRAKSGDPEKPVSDQFLDPFVIVDSAGAPVGTVQVCKLYALLHLLIALIPCWFARSSSIPVPELPLRMILLQ